MLFFALWEWDGRYILQYLYVSCSLYAYWFRTVSKPKIKTFKAQAWKCEFSIGEVSTTESISTRNLGFLPLVVYSFYDAVSLHEGIIRIIINFIVENTLYD